MCPPKDAYGPEAVAIMGRAFEEAWRELNAKGIFDRAYSPHVMRTRVALRILEAAQRGERDPDRLKYIALRTVKRSVAR